MGTHVQSKTGTTTNSDLDEVELGDFSGYKLYPLSEWVFAALHSKRREKRANVQLVRARSARAVHFQDESGGALDQV